jgi:hypothetical protein
MFDWLKRVLGQAPAAPVRAADPAPTAAPAPTAITVPAPAAKAPLYTEAELLEDVRRQVERDLAGGFVSRDEIVQYAVEAFADEVPGAPVEATARRALDEALAARAIDEATWPAVTDCDRLDAAFAALEAEGVISRQNFTCCGSCGSSEIWDEMGKVRDAGGPVTGYAFYHQQDTERAAEGGGLYFNYGAVEDSEAAALAVGHRIMVRLREQGLEPDWDGRIEQRIGLELDWKRRAVSA